MWREGGMWRGRKKIRQMRRMKSSHTSSSGSVPDRLFFFFIGPRYKTLASIFNEMLMLLHLDALAELGPSGTGSQEGH